MMDEHSTFWNDLWNDFIGVIIIVGYMVCSFISFLIYRAIVTGKQIGRAHV